MSGPTGITYKAAGKDTNVYFNGLYIGFKPAGSDSIYLQKCGDANCRRENYSMNIMSGCCTWCPFDANKEAGNAK